MRVFILPSFYKSQKYPGSCLFIYEQAQALRRLGHTVVVLSVQQTPVWKISEWNGHIRKFDDNGIITYETEILTLSPSRFQEMYISRFAHSMHRLIRQAIAEQGNPDVYYAHFSFAAGVAATRLKQCRPLVVEEHYSKLMENPDKKLVKSVVETVYGSNRFICVSAGLRKAVDGFAPGASNIVTISNMIDPCFTFFPIQREEPFVFFSMGGLIYRKGYDILIPAFAQVFSRNKNVILRIAGQGPEEERLRSLVHEYGMDKQIQLIGQITREQSLEEYKNCHCFVLPSRAETYGLVYREALVVGRPVISTKHGGFDNSNWHSEYGILVDIDNIEQLARALHDVYINYERYCLPQISELCEQECSENIVAQRIEAVLSSCMKNGIVGSGE